MTLTRQDLMSLEQYAERRHQFRAQVMEHKKNRRVALGEHAALYFEDALTMQYQIQEMLRIERIFEARAIEEEMAVYAPLIPDGSNWKATFMIEYGDEAERRQALARLIGIESRVYVQVAGLERVYAIANEDLDRSSPDKTAAVHFMRFELNPEMLESVKKGEPILAGIDHPAYLAKTPFSPAVRAALVKDFLA
ncbi:MAG: DUF3501 family protein [Pseudomonadota bacterium]